METTIIYDTYVNNIDSTAGNNYGTAGKLSVGNEVVRFVGGNYGINSRHILIRPGISLIGLAECRIRLYFLSEYTTGPGIGSRAYLDLYSCAEPFIENEVTWLTQPKVSKLAENVIVHTWGSSPSYYEIDLLPYVDRLANGLMLKMKINQEQPSERSQYIVDFYSSESPKPPILYYRYGTKPAQPKIISPIWGTIINKKTTSTIRFDWESTGQTNYIFEYSQDNENWISKTGTTAKYYNLPTTELENGNLYVRVKIKADNIWSDYSQTWFLQIGEKPNTPVVSLTGATTSTPRINWNTNPLQYMYQVQVLQGETIIEKSGELKGNATSYNLKTRLESGKTYTFKVRIADKYEIWSDWATNTTLISFVKPPKPVITLYSQSNRGSILVNIENPQPGTGEETTVYNEVFRKEEDGEWIRIASDVNKRFIDYTVKSKTIYLYKVRAIGQNGYNDSDLKSTEVKIRYSDLAIVGEWDKYVKLKYNDNKKQNTGYSGEILKFAGRDKPVVEFEDTYNNGIALYFELTKKEDLDMLQSIIDSRKTLLYRDSRGRKTYGSVTTKLDIEDLNFNHYGVSFTFTETDYSEVV